MRFLNALLVTALFSIGWSGLSSAREFSLNSVETIIQNPHVKTLEDFIVQVPPFMKSANSFTLAYNPHGLLHGSFSSPLAYLFGDSRSSVVLVFKAHPPQSKGENDFVEILSFDALTKKHSLAKISFPDNGKPMIEHHPRACVTCHGTSEKPLWRSGYHWEGFFGSKIDDLNKNPTEKSAMSRLIANPGERLQNLDLGRAYGSGLKMGNNNISLSVKLATEHAAAIAARITANPAFREKSAALFYALSLCERNNAALLEKSLLDFGVSREEWYLNREAKPDRGSPGYYSLPGQSFEYGVGPIEYMLLTQILKNDPKHPLRASFKRFILHYGGAPVGSSIAAESMIQKISKEAPAGLVAPFTFDQNSTRPSQRWCSKLSLSASGFNTGKN